MASLYSRYLTEKTDQEIIETEQGFAIYRYLDEGKTVYISDVYVLPDFRKDGVASAIADLIVERAKLRGATELLGSVIPSNKEATLGLRVLLAYGMTLKSSTNDFILLKKDI